MLEKFQNVAEEDYVVIGYIESQVERIERDIIEIIDSIRNFLDELEILESMKADKLEIHEAYMKVLSEHCNSTGGVKYMVMCELINEDEKIVADIKAINEEITRLKVEYGIKY